MTGTRWTAEGVESATVEVGTESSLWNYRRD